MGDYFRHARAVTRTLARAQRIVRPPASAELPVRRVGRQFEVASDGVRFVNLERAASQPSLWLEAFRIALEQDCAVSEQALDCIEQHVAPLLRRRFRRDRRGAAAAAHAAPAAARPVRAALGDARLRAARRASFRSSRRFTAA